MSVAWDRPKLRQNFEIAFLCARPSPGTEDEELWPKYQNLMSLYVRCASMQAVYE